LVPFERYGQNRRMPWKLLGSCSLSASSAGASPSAQLICHTDQRGLEGLFFGYSHRFEAYLPKAKRTLGYFALPVLVDGEIVAAIDLKTDRQDKKLLIQNWSWAGDKNQQEQHKTLRPRIEDELHRFERFQLDT
jgi:uncharacterized protein YcaQ